jgi:hypothetical protein
MILYSEVYLNNGEKIVITDTLALLCLIAVVVNFIHALTALHTVTCFLGNATCKFTWVSDLDEYLLDDHSLHSHITVIPLITFLDVPPQRHNTPAPLLPVKCLLLCSELNCPYLSSDMKLKVKVKVKVILRLTISQSVSLGIEHPPGPMTRYLLLLDRYGLVSLGRPL